MKILCVGDTHFPFVKQVYLNKVYDWTVVNQPEVILQIGDLYDMYSFSRYTQAINYMTPEQEVKKGRIQAEKMWTQFKIIAPQAKRYQLMGNHCGRIIKRVLENLPGLDARIKVKGKTMKLHNIDELFKFDDVYSLLDYRAELTLHNTLFIHGFKGNIGEHVKYFRRNVVTGHLHRGGIVYLRQGNKTFWELNCGYLADNSKLPFQYGETKTSNWTPGFGVLEVECGVFVPRFIQL